MKKITLILGLLGVMVFYQNCSKVGFSNVSSEDGPIVDLCVDLADNPEECERPFNVLSGLMTYTQPAAELTQKVDLLFVTDTSGSLNQERNAVANGLQNFIENLPPNVDWRIAVLLAHGSTSPWAGRLYNSRNSEPVVIDSENYTVEQAQDILRDKLTDLEDDRNSDGGEEGLYSISELVGDAQKLANAKALGFLRDDAALSVIFIADENDICAEYPDGVTPVPDPQGIEPIAYQMDCVPNNITAATTYQKLVNAKLGLPLSVNGVLYTDPLLVPDNGENEVGYGYTDIIALNQGKAAEITNDIAEGLGEIGTLVSVGLNLQTRFVMADENMNDCADQMIKESIYVTVDGAPVAHTFVPSACEIQLDAGSAGQALSELEIHFDYKVFLDDLPDPDSQRPGNP